MSTPASMVTINDTVYVWYLSTFLWDVYFIIFTEEIILLYSSRNSNNHKQSNVLSVSEHKDQFMDHNNIVFWSLFLFPLTHTKRKIMFYSRFLSRFFLFYNLTIPFQQNSRHADLRISQFLLEAVHRRVLDWIYFTFFHGKGWDKTFLKKNYETQLSGV